MLLLVDFFVVELLGAAFFVLVLFSVFFVVDFVELAFFAVGFFAAVFLAAGFASDFAFFSGAFAFTVAVEVFSFSAFGCAFVLVDVESAIFSIATRV